MDNGTLTYYLQRNKEQFSLRGRLELLRDVAAGLRYRKESFSHSNLKLVPQPFAIAFLLYRSWGPHGSTSYFRLTSLGSNVLVSAPGRAQLSDFGLSGITKEFLGTSYLPSSMNGTSRWAAPEIFTTYDDESSA
ncbi:hypothetical protein PAXRUDRAFT_13840 [Paxillus rubicundulus Ve08.2h10]|uniref:Protein kinase domain-containing protein n=1 Tax=Paxillus rubicundulus Ve08.2h10 TaxID=930991 RepID=A0A0D0E326_9AGAM|nr:hypothetical protein PAXRUDRAFT_13840 [Paxillus rubicundulus Ve08.2h10]